MKNTIPNYINKHWKGELSLRVSFWVNYLGFHVFFWVLGHLLTGRKSYLSPVQSARFALLIYTIIMVIYPWRIVGLWRCCSNYSHTHRKSVKVMFVRIIIILGVLATTVIHITQWPAHKLRFERSFFKDRTAQYTLTLKQDNTLLHLEGSMGYGLSRDVKKILSKNPGIKGVILDTPGGRAYEGRQLSKLIRKHELDTYSMAGCSSAGTIAFLAGKKRYLAIGCPLIFHQAQMENEHLARTFDAEEIQKKDYEIYPSEEIERSFFEKVLIEIKAKKYWIPTKQELLDAHVIHEIIIEIQDVLTLKELDFNLYQNLKNVIELETQLGIDGGSLDLDSLQDRIREGLTLEERKKLFDQLQIRIEKLQAQIVTDEDPNDLGNQ